MVEVLSQSISDEFLTPNYHPLYLLANVYATALPLIWFSNIIYSKALLVTVAARTFTYGKKPVGKTRPPDPPKIWGMAIPRDGSHSYQYWVVHLNGRNGSKFQEESTVNERSKFTKFESALEMILANQFDSMREDEKRNVREVWVKTEY